MSVAYFIPVAVYGALALGVLLFSGRGGGLKAAIIASYCGVIITSFTGGASGGVWLVQVFVFLAAPVALFRAPLPAWGSRNVSLLTYVMLALYLVGVVVAMMRFDPSLELYKAGRFVAFGGVPIRILIAGYRLTVIAGLALAFILPLRTSVDRELMRKCLTLCWVFSLVLALFGVLDYFSVGDFAFSYRREAGFGHVAVMGFHRGAIGVMLMTGIFLSFAMTQMAVGPVRRAIAYGTAPLMFIALLFTWSRSATLAMAVGAVSLALTLGGLRAVKGVLVTLFGAVTVYAILSRFPDVQERFSFFLTGTIEEGTTSRLEGWTNLILWLFRNPDVIITGAGTQNFNFYVNLESTAVTLEAAHNNYLHILTETGLLGFIVFLGWLAAIFTWLVRWRRHQGEPVIRMLTGVFMSLMIALAVSCLTQESLAPSPSMVPYLMHFYLILGLWISFYRTETCQQFVALDAAAAAVRPAAVHPAPPLALPARAHAT